MYVCTYVCIFKYIDLLELCDFLWAAPKLLIAEIYKVNAHLKAYTYVNVCTYKQTQSSSYIHICTYMYTYIHRYVRMSPQTSVKFIIALSYGFLSSFSFSWALAQQGVF